MERPKNNHSTSLMQRERRYIRIDNKICFLDENYYEKVFCKDANCLWPKIFTVVIIISIIALIGLL